MTGTSTQKAANRLYDFVYLFE